MINRLRASWGKVPESTGKTRADEIKEKFIQYHQSHPEVWEMFKRFSFEAVSAGRGQFSSSAIVERIRWEVSIAHKEGDPFKICNDFRAYYARMFMATYPQHKAFFRIRKLRSKEDLAVGDDEALLLSSQRPIGNESDLMAELSKLGGAA